MYQAYRQYVTMQVSTADPKQLVILLFDRALLACRRVLDRTAADLSVRAKEVNRAKAILQELNGGLDHEAAPELCNNLSRLYTFWIGLLSRSHLGRSAEHVATVERQMRSLRDAFAQAFAADRALSDVTAA
jgi:flagellar protein FliS